MTNDSQGSQPFADAKPGRREARLGGGLASLDGCHSEAFNGRLLFGQVWRRHDGRRWIYKKFTEYARDRDT
jgi:hypothetical protein